VTVEQKTSDPDQVPVADRRDHVSGSLDSEGWETIVLRRVARRVELLSSDADSPGSERQDHGWEQAALRALRRRVRELEPE
jgi:hypothetical protein